ncbi:M13 family metallopeptidase [Scleromatobacter humisilvae]|uniref:M13 family peptidase n=1 Tax=Scleromatobacter humisilvae TaxID=2897159 RepID=A0A9X1YP26_9BURK|nr:M13-type metalloendopeptidase [Scleromatobacter humisilvae]MCK9689055.1 M13 family peptidase [Scleromatobacter humisilvae]
MTAPNFRRAALAAAALLAVASVHAQTATTTTTTVETTTTTSTATKTMGSGIDRSGMDTSVRPQDDLFLAMNGTWVKNTQIPADKSRWGTFDALRDRTDHEVRDLVEGLQATHPAAGSDAQKINDFFRSYVDEAAIDKAGLAPIEASLKDVDSIRDTGMLVGLMGHWQGVVRTPLGVDANPDVDDPGVYIASFRQGGLGLPDRDYYLKADERFAKARAAYTDYLARLFTLSGDADGPAHAARVVALETKIAAAQWPRDRTRDQKLAHNPKTPAELDALAPGFDFPTFEAQAQLPPGKIIVVRQPDYVTALAGLLKSEPLDTWKLYMKSRRLDSAATVLPAGFRDASYQFHQVTIAGVKERQPRWQDAVQQMNGGLGVTGPLGEAVGQLYVARYFPPAYRARMQALVANLMKAYSTSIDGLTWMSPATKKEAHLKLSKYNVKIGYPDVWRDYGALVMKPGDALGNADRAAAFEYHREIVRIGGKVDRTEWGMTPQTINAYYSGNKNEIVFPAAILQPPFFNVAADDAVNYGAIGAVIGHEISHGFDDQGSQLDGDGRLRNWWTDDDRKAFDEITGRLVAQYSAYEPIPGQHLNGKLTLGENIADLSGLQISYKAWKLSLDGKPSPVIDGFTGEQRFIYGFAQVWRGKVRDERELELIATDPHSAAQFRADGTTINADAYHDAFHTKPGDKMWKAPEDRLRLW